MGDFRLAIEGDIDPLFTENDTNAERLFGVPNASPYVKDAFHAAIVDGRAEAVNPDQRGSKAAAHLRAMIEPGATLTLRLRLARSLAENPFNDVDSVLAARTAEADAF
jgi:hypothetical protein